MEFYKIQQVSSKLIFITWLITPNAAISQRFINELKALVEAHEDGVYFISDLRRGRIIDMKYIQELSKLSQHPNWKGSSAFTQNSLSRIFAGTYHKMLVKQKERNMFFEEATEAIAFLEQLETGLTLDVDWDTLLST